MGIVSILVLFFILIVLGVPIAFSFGLASVAYLLINMPDNLSILTSRNFGALDSFALLAIPLFVFSGDLMKEGGLSKTIVDFVYLFVRKIRAGLAHVTVLACVFFGAISGSSAATVAAIGGIMIPEMVKRGYKKEYAVTVSSAAGFLGILIPPSIPLIIYAMSTEVSVSRLFLAGIGPGIVMAVAFMTVNFFMDNKYKDASFQGATAGTMEVAQSKEVAKKAIPALIMPLIILGGIYSGVFTPTESGAIAVLYGILVGFFFYRGLNFKSLLQIGKESSYTSALILIVVAMAGVFGWIVTTQRVPTMLSDFVISLTDNKYIVLLILNIFYLILGCFMETITAIVITTPIFLPLITMLEIDLIHFGIIQTVNLCVGLITPPMALNLLIGSRIGGIPVARTIKPLLPYFFASLIVLVLVTYIPEISLFLPNLLVGK